MVCLNTGELTWETSCGEKIVIACTCDRFDFSDT